MENFDIPLFSERLSKEPDAVKAAVLVANKTFDIKEALKKEWHSKKEKKMDVIKKYLDDLKWLLSRMNFMPSGAGTRGQPKETELLTVRDILEIGARYSIAVKDMNSFDSYMAQLKCYYFDLRNCFSSESTSMFELLGLNLLKLLSENRISEFHTELELFVHNDVNRVLKDPYISKVIRIEQNLTEGRYNQIYKAKGDPDNSTTQDYKYFIELLLDTIKDGIADCVEASYESLSIQDAAKVLNITSDKEIKDFASKRKWNVDSNGLFCFDCKYKQFSMSAEDRKLLIEQSLNYAKDLEMIV